MEDEIVNYSTAWRKKNPHSWELAQLKWYYKNRQRIITGQSRPRSPEPDAFDLWAWRNDNLPETPTI